MTVSELIKILKKYPPDIRVLNGAYEGEYHDMIENFYSLKEKHDRE